MSLFCPNVASRFFSYGYKRQMAVRTKSNCRFEAVVLNDGRTNKWKL